MKSQFLPLMFGILLISMPINVTTYGQTMVYPQNSTNSTTIEYHSNGIPVFSDETYKQRIDGIPSEIDLTFNEYVKRNIEVYTVRKRNHTQKILGRTQMYFPMFDEYLRKYNLPPDLKYVAIIESALKPTAVSKSGAGGLWQFMPFTGKEMGLSINDYVDERCDPEKSTDAAMRYLGKLNKRYDNWLFAIAAYNCGPGRVNKAIRRARSKKFWKVYRYLPRETRNYVPAFIAVTYIMNYYETHNLNPEYPETDLQVTSKMKVYEHTKLSDVAYRCNSDLATITLLNPSYLAGFIPANAQGTDLIIPTSKVPFYTGEIIRDDEVAKVQKPVGEKAFLSQIIEGHKKIVYEVQSGETIWDVARQYPGVSVQDIVKENKLAEYGKIKPGLHLKIPSS